MTLAVVLGGVTAVFSLVNGVFLRPLPYREAARLVTVNVSDRIVRTRSQIPYPLYEELAHRVTSAEGLAALRFVPFSLQDERWHAVIGAVVSPNLFDVLQPVPILGRGLLSGDDITEGDYPVVLSKAAWRRLFFGDPGILGRHVRLSDDQTAESSVYVVVGVTSAVIASPRGEAVDLYVSERRDAAIRRWWPAFEFKVIGRLRPQRTPNDIVREAELVLRQSRDRLVGVILDGASVEPFDDELRTGWTDRLWTLFAVSALVLCMACANIGNLLASSWLARGSEFFTRVALGATSARIARQLLLENLITSVVGGALAVGLAAASLAPILATAPTGVPLLADASVDWRVVVFGLLTASVFGLLVAFPAVWMQFHHVRRGATTRLLGGLRRHSRWGVEGAVACQVALGMALSATAALTLGSQWRLIHAPLGFSADNVLTATLDVGRRFADDDAYHRFQQRLLDLRAAIPDVETLAVSDALPPMPSGTSTLTLPDGRRLGVLVRFVSGTYFEALRIGMKSGRVPVGGEPLLAKVAVNEAFAMLWFGRTNVVGESIDVVDGRLEIVAVTQEAREFAVRKPAPPTLYRFWEGGTRDAQHRRYLLARTRTHSSRTETALREALRRLDPDLPVTTQWLEDRLAADRAETAFYARVLLFFSFVTMLVAAVGVSALTKQSIARRRREAAIRLAVGATLPAIRWHLLRRTVLAWGLGMLAGAWLATIIGALLKSALYDLTPSDPTILSVSALFVSAVTLVSGSCPLRQVTDSDMSKVLRAE
jgi:putative ABC transport system permease protein